MKHLEHSVTTPQVTTYCGQTFEPQPFSGFDQIAESIMECDCVTCLQVALIEAREAAEEV